MLEIRPGDVTLKRAKFAGGQIGAGEGEPQDVPGIAIERIVMERFHRGADNAAIRQMLFGDNGPSLRKADASALAAQMKSFARRVFRRPVTDEQLAGYVSMVRQALAEGQDFTAALRVGYRAILCSPRFLYLTEEPGKLDDYAIAARLSYLLTGSTPDAELSRLADSGGLKEPAIIRQQVERLLAGGGGRRFVEDFAAQWLDLDQIDFTEPDSKLYPEFDPIVQHSMLDETRTFLETMLRYNVSVTNLAAADFTFLNSRLAKFYRLDGVAGDELRQVKLQPASHRGGVLTQGAILKVTANGSNTSPVVRGKWIAEKLLGEEIPPPPDNVPAIEPDIRGAKTIREMLAKHREQESCGVCHVKIDPYGFALENYDPAGQWREHYVRLVNGKRDQGAVIDASSTLPGGQAFKDLAEFRSVVAKEPQVLARCVAQKLLVYGTGAPISFADRRAIDEIVKASADEKYGFRSILHAVVTSDVFLSK